MVETETGETDIEKLVKTAEEVKAKLDRQTGAPKRLTNGYLRPHQVKGRLYYSYKRRGEDEETYLGSAEAILKAVKKDTIKDDR